MGNNSYTTSLEPAHAAEDHGHDELPMEDSNLKDGQIILKANPPPDGKYIWVQKDNEDQFTVETDGVVRCKALLSSGGLETLDDGAFAHKYENSTAEDPNYIRVGRQGNTGETTVGLLDGIHHKRTIDGQVQDYMQQLHPTVPKIDIVGTTNPNVDWIRITDDDTDDTVFAVHSDGTIETTGWGRGSRWWCEINTSRFSKPMYSYRFRRPRYMKNYSSRTRFRRTVRVRR